MEVEHTTVFNDSAGNTKSNNISTEKTNASSRNNRGHELLRERKTQNELLSAPWEHEGQLDSTQPTGKRGTPHISPVFKVLPTYRIGGIPPVGWLFPFPPLTWLLASVTPTEGNSQPQEGTIPANNNKYTWAWHMAIDRLISTLYVGNTLQTGPIRYE